ncbi:serine hydrolase [Brevibacterium sp. ZH18]|uniref:D-alanyl-D-alanine carboxypeptidase family protein n=1 Tax=Brevibacterium sp. ZH18 TaxID=2927784 RepID=UPI001F618D7F|nr:serine hydrolase [Brevibacterium sp. ZH18]MCI4013151.1 serine hydrolase [Brevibacterium sp. ZH18]
MRSNRPTSSAAASALAAASTRTPRGRALLGFTLALILVLSQLVLSPGVSHAQSQPSKKAEKVYVSPDNLGDGSKPPAPVGTSWLVGDLDSGDLQVAHDIDKKHAPASTIKLLTALALVDVLDDRKKKVQAEFEDMEIDGTKVGLMQKNDYTIDLLFHAMLMSSANDAANALGRAAGGQEKAVALMNEKAAELGMTNTHAVNTSGLDAKGQFTTASDMMKLAWAVCENDYLMKVIGTETFKFPGGKNPDTKEKFKGYEIQNHTKIVGQVDGGLGLKNGYTKTAKGSYIAVAERDGHRVVATMLGVDNNSRQAAVDLLEWDFAQKDPKSLQTVPVGQTVTASTDPSATASETTSDAGGDSTGGDATASPNGSKDSAEDSASSRSSSLLALSGADLVPIGLLAVGVLLLMCAGLLWLRVRKRRHAQ